MYLYAQENGTEKDREEKPDMKPFLITVLNTRKSQNQRSAWTNQDERVDARQRNIQNCGGMGPCVQIVEAKHDISPDEPRKKHDFGS